MRQTVVPGVWSWSRWQPDRNLDFNGFFIETAEGNLVVDPVEPDEETLAALRERGVATVLITNRDHERSTAAVAAATGARTVASALDAPLLAQPVDGMVQPGDHVHGWKVIGLDGCKTAGEIALYDRTRRAAIVGDVMWGTPAGALTFMPDAKLADAPRAVLSVRQLRALTVDHLLVGDGACLFGNAHDVLQAALEARTDALTTRINLFDEVAYTGSPEDPQPFTGAWSEVGRLIGAQKLGYGITRLARGEAFAPLHWHTREEELFVVIAGTPALRTPRGTFPLRAGDAVAFRTEPSGAHRISNESESDAIVLMIANSDPGDVCYYPDSRKFVVEATGTLVHDHPQLDYFHDEA